MPVTQETFKLLALEDPEGQWELHHGRLREKPTMSFTHNETLTRLGLAIGRQIDEDHYVLRINTGRVKRSDETYYVPDVFVIAQSPRERSLPTSLEIYEQPALFIAEVWSPSSANYDVDQKLPEYQRRGDLEIWRVHPLERSVKIWVRSADGSYDSRTVSSGVIELSAIPNVRIELRKLFAYS
jgi:Uma2 family endonuclease